MACEYHYFLEYHALILALLQACKGALIPRVFYKWPSEVCPVSTS